MVTWAHQSSQHVWNDGMTSAAAADAAFPLHGVVRRTQLLRMLKFRIGMYALDPNAPVPPSQSQIPTSQVIACCLLHTLLRSLLCNRAVSSVISGSTATRTAVSCVQRLLAPDSLYGA